MGRTAGAHIIFCVDLKEEAVLFPLGEYRRQMFVLEAGASETSNGMRREERDGHGQNKAQVGLPDSESWRRTASRQVLSRLRQFTMRLTWKVARQRRERTLPAAGNLNCVAGSGRHELPGISLEIDSRRALACRAGAGRAII